MGHPVLAYTIQAALDSALFSSLVIATDSTEIASIASYYGADSIFMRSPSSSSSTSLDIEWLQECYFSRYINTDNFAILRPTSPFRSAEMLNRVMNAFVSLGVDSIRTVSLVKEHPGKMWVVDENQRTMTSYLPQKINEIASHAKQYQSLQKLYVQTSVLEIAKTSVLTDFGTREGGLIAPYVTQGVESLALDTEMDWYFAEMLANREPGLLPPISKSSFPGTGHK
jgi:CMP-N-acetylneuraminic acid synthetase